MKSLWRPLITTKLPGKNGCTQTRVTIRSFVYVAMYMWLTCRKHNLTIKQVTNNKIREYTVLKRCCTHKCRRVVAPPNGAVFHKENNGLKGSHFWLQLHTNYTERENNNCIVLSVCVYAGLCLIVLSSTVSYRPCMVSEKYTGWPKKKATTI